MFWYLVTIFSGFSFATADAISKKASKYTSPLVLAWVREAFALPFLLPILLFIEIPQLDNIFWYALITCTVFDFVATYLFMKAIKIAPLSLTVPYLGLTPIFSLLFSFFILGEQVTVIGLIGILLVSIGAYTLRLDTHKFGWLAPFKAIFQYKGSLLRFFLAIIYAFTVNMAKVTIQHSSPLFMVVTYFSLLALVYTPFVLVQSGGKTKNIFAHSGIKFLIGLAMAFMALSHFTAVSKINVSYMISIKRFSLLFAVLYGKFFFNEENIKERFTGGVLIVAGAACIAFA